MDPIDLDATNDPEADSMAAFDAGDDVSICASDAGTDAHVWAPDVVVDETPLPPMPGLREVASMHSGRFAHLSFVTNEGTLLVVGGSGSSAFSDDPILEVEEYDPRSDAWATVALWPDPTSRPHVGVSLSDGRPFVVTSGTSEATGYTFEGTPRTWRMTAPPPPELVPASAALIDDGRVFILDEHGPAYVFDPARNSWASAGKSVMADPRHAIALAANRVAVLGVARENLEVWDGTSGTWSRIPPPPIGFGDVAVRLADGRLSITGWYRPEPASGTAPDYKFLPTPIETFDFADCAWSVSWIPRPIGAASPIGLSTGEVLYLDGVASLDGAGRSDLSATARFDLASGESKLYAPFEYQMPNIDKLSSGTIIVTGGTVPCGHGGCHDVGVAKTWRIDRIP